MQDYKIRIPNADISRQVQEKAFELGYGRNRYLTNNPSDCNHMYLYTDQSEPAWGTTVEHFRNHSNPEISYQDFLRLGEQPIINNTTTEIMSGEVTLKCITAPQKAKNIIEGRDYTGILIDSDDSQVDTLREATHFRCVNNNGIEAKYKLALFAPIEPPSPPKITQQQFIDGLNILADRVSITFHGDTLRVLDFGYNVLSDDGTTCSCGVHSSNGLDNLWDRLESDGIQNTSIIENYDADDLVDGIFKAIVLARVANVNAGLVLFSTTEDSSLVCELMDWLAENQGGHGTDFLTNPNSGNQIKAWLIPKN